MLDKDEVMIGMRSTLGVCWWIMGDTTMICNDCLLRNRQKVLVQYEISKELIPQAKWVVVHRHILQVGDIETCDECGNEVCYTYPPLRLVKNKSKK